MTAASLLSLCCAAAEVTRETVTTLWKKWPLARVYQAQIIFLEKNSFWVVRKTEANESALDTLI